jgi:hypothetical protein
MIMVVKYWVDKKVMRKFFNFFSTYAIKDYKQHIILIQNGSDDDDNSLFLKFKYKFK